MNIFKKFYCRTYQTAFRIMLPILPYREPKILNNPEELCEVLQKKKIEKVLLVTDEGICKLGLISKTVSALQEAGIEVTIFDKTVPNPTTKVVEEAYELYLQNDCQALIGFGGGSPIDCAKAVGVRVAKPKKPLSKLGGVLKVRKKIPLLIAVPTTAGTGSETTLVSVITDSETRHKYAINDFPLIPRYAILDAELTVGLPKHITSTTGMDALTHAIEAYIGRSTTKHTRKCALEAIKLIFENLETAYNDGANLTARENMLHASYLAGVAFTQSYVGYVHAIAHSLGGAYDIPHGLANAVILPYVLKAFGRKIYKKLHKIGVFCGFFDETESIEVGAKIVIEKIEELSENMNIQKHIPEIKESDIANLAKTAAAEANPLYPVPVIFDAKQLEKLYIKIKG